MSKSMEFEKITAEMPITGFTGALGSGCTYLAKGLEEYHNYAYCSLSEPIHAELAKRRLPPTSENLQNVGNELRQRHGLDCLVVEALKVVDGVLRGPGVEKPAGVVVDGIRNTAEVRALRAWPHFYLFSVQAAQEMRQQRVLKTQTRCKNEAEFLAADARDANEQKPEGQQVTPCNYLADIIVLNEKEISDDAQLSRQKYISEKVYNRYVMLIERLARGDALRDNRAAKEEALMTAAYVVSKQSSCVKRKVGAIITSPDGDVVSAGHNEVPEASKPCIEDPRFGWCARDVIQESVGREFKHCPNCGAAISVRGKCHICGHEVVEFCKRCPKCHSELNVAGVCNACKTDVFTQFLPGADPERTGRLLDLCRALHAEENAILSLSKTGVNVPNDAVLYTTTFPCNLCANKIVAVGIRTVVYAEPYPMKEAERIFKEKGVALKRFEGVKSNAYFRMYS